MKRGGTLFSYVDLEKRIPVRLLLEQMDCNLLFRWFVSLCIDDPVWVPKVFSKNRERLLMTDMSRKVMAAILAHCEVAPLLLDEHFSVDGTLIKAWASMKSFQLMADAAPPDDEGPGDPPAPEATLEPAPYETPTETDPMPRNSHRHRNAEVDFKGEKRSNTTHASTTDPDARLYMKSPGTGAVLCFMGHALMENRHGFVVQGDLPHAPLGSMLRMRLPGNGWSCRTQGRAGHDPSSFPRIDPAADAGCPLSADFACKIACRAVDKGYDAAGFVPGLRQACVTPHVAQKARYSAIDGHTT